MNAWAVPTAIKCGKYLCLPLRYFSHRGVKSGLSSALSPIFGSRHRRLVVDRVQHPHRGVKSGLSPVHSPIFGSRHRRLVGLDGLEPSTSRLSGARSNHLSYRPLFRWSFVLCPSSFAASTAGGDDGNRTHDPLLAGQVLSQLSYTPIRAFEVTVLKN